MEAVIRCTTSEITKATWIIADRNLDNIVRLFRDLISNTLKLGKNIDEVIRVHVDSCWSIADLNILNISIIFDDADCVAKIVSNIENTRRVADESRWALQVANTIADVNIEDFLRVANFANRVGSIVGDPDRVFTIASNCDRSKANRDAVRNNRIDDFINKATIISLIACARKIASNVDTATAIRNDATRTFVNVDCINNIATINLADCVIKVVCYVDNTIWIFADAIWSITNENIPSMNAICELRYCI